LVPLPGGVPLPSTGATSRRARGGARPSAEAQTAYKQSAGEPYGDVGRGKFITVKKRSPKLKGSNRATGLTRVGDRLQHGIEVPKLGGRQNGASSRMPV